jgi:hypothetical protein
MTEPSFAADPLGGPAKHLLTSQHPIGRTAEPEENIKRQLVEIRNDLGLYAQTLKNSVKLDFRLPQSGAALVC